ncbi:thioredoxin [Natronoarchaeum philippinense]|uniref:Thioredoxin n=1 Tax=Natronoarchaeum philippinense TaxID=558529 RepID=A0A285P842_NATPI|nr:thioredoxin [Natronoarchaeum philippinense]SNZ17882.1 thioredoxin [Natronoarchaeum philippinense]
MAEDIEEIRKRKMEELRNRTEGGDAEAAQRQLTEPMSVDGKAELNETVTKHDVVLADFYADWCGPCKMIEPVVKGIARDTDAVVAKVDVDANQQLAGEYGVRGVPTLVLFADGEPVERLSGMQDDAQLRNLVQSYT